MLLVRPRNEQPRPARWRRASSLVSLTVILLGAGHGSLVALPLTPFRYEAQAQRHCPHDKVVWLDLRKGIYYAKGQRHYAQGFDGSFVCSNEARSSRYRRSVLGLR
jgi:hypothetical protein